MRNNFIHPDTRVEGSGGTQYTKLKPQTPNHGGDNFMNSIMTEQGGAIGNTIGNAIGGEEGQIASTLIKVGIDIVQTILSNGASQVNAEDEGIIGNSDTKTQSAFNSNQQLTNNAVANSTELTEEAVSTAETGKEDIDASKEIITEETNNALEKGDKLQNRGKEVQDIINKNNEQIQQKQSRQQELLGIICDLRSKNNIKSQPKSKPHKSEPSPPLKDNHQQAGQVNTPWAEFSNKGTDMSSNETEGFVPIEMSGNAELDGAINQYNQLGVEIQTLVMINTAQTETFIQEQDVADESINLADEITDEEAQNINDQAQLIMETFDNAQSAISEISNLLQGEFPKINKVTAIEIAGMMAKQAISGTESGVLAAAAAAMGVASFFSMGQTAQKAAELTQGSVNKGQISIKSALQAVAQRALQQAQNTIQQEGLSAIGNSLNTVIGEQNISNTYMNTIMSSIPQDLLDKIQLNKNSEKS